MCCCPEDTNDGAPASSSALDAAWALALLLDFAAEPTGALSNGNYTMQSGETVTIGNAAAASTFRMLNGSGLEVVNTTANTQWNTGGGGQSAPVLWFQLGRGAGILAGLLPGLIPDYDPHLQYLHQIRVTLNAANAASEGVVLSMWQPAANQYAAGAIGIAGGWHGSNVTIAPHLGVGMVANTATPVLVDIDPGVNAAWAGFDVLGITNSPGNPSALAATAGLYDAANDAWPAMQDLRECGYVASTATPTGLTGVRYTDPTTRLALAFPTGNTTGTGHVIVEQYRCMVRNPRALAA